MNADRVNEIRLEEAARTMAALEVADLPADVKADIHSVMKELVTAIDRWAMKENRVVDGRVCIGALEILHEQMRATMQRIMDEDVGAHGPHKN